MFQIFAKGVRTITLSVEGTDTVLSLKNLIWDREGVPTHMQMLVYNGRVLENDRTLAECGIQRESTVFWQIRFGMKLEAE